MYSANPQPGASEGGQPDATAGRAESSRQSKFGRPTEHVQTSGTAMSCPDHAAAFCRPKTVSRMGANHFQRAKSKRHHYRLVVAPALTGMFCHS